MAIETEGGGVAHRAHSLPGLGPVSLRPRTAREQTGVVLLVDAANVIGSRPTGWWRDRAGAARGFIEQIRTAMESGRITEKVTVVLEGKARDGAESGSEGDLTVVHAARSGDDTLIEVAAGTQEPVTLVSADRELRDRAQALGADVVGPGWLLGLLES